MSSEKLKDAGGTALGFLIFVVLITVTVVFLFGAAEFSVWALDWIPNAVGMATLACIVLIPLMIIPVTRGFAGVLLLLASFVFGACLWLYALAFTYIEWGMLGVVIGVLVFGVGVIFTGALAALLTGTWVVLGNIAFLLALFVGARLLAAWMAQLADQRELRKAIHQSPSRATITQDPSDKWSL